MMMMKSVNCLYCYCAEQCEYIFDDKEPCPLIELEAEEGGSDGEDKLS